MEACLTRECAGFKVVPRAAATLQLNRSHQQVYRTVNDIFRPMISLRYCKNYIIYSFAKLG